MSEFKELEKLKKELENYADRSSQIRILAEYLLEHLKATTISKSKSSHEVFKAYKDLYDSNPEFIPIIPENTFIVSLSKVSSEQGTKINCPGRRQGYYLEQLVQTIEKIEEETKKETEVKEKAVEEDSKSKSLIQEKSLYPILKSWLFEKDYDRVADVSNLKSNGKWGNPDLVGLKIEDIYGRPEVEITTIEVKLTEDNWEQWIFESIAHTRFSNRSYFAFLYPENLFNKLDSTDIKLYAEHFNVGVLIIEIEGQEYLKIKSKDPVDLNEEKLRIIEYHQAPYNQTHIKFRKKFLKALDILELNKLYRFGEELD
ncbi:hypothetical protein [Maribellus sp. YY47]|uniref:hypothetical protein n=1 Tax=Maribellus sp. YY47 TaxID=2929486 RepID=UPI002001567A|nr:hypothetical protein [Maribellus sp. YY47]MCK3686429.1 hypothetical protein [Maribellus sp. YY47]